MFRTAPSKDGDYVGRRALENSAASNDHVGASLRRFIDRLGGKATVDFDVDIWGPLSEGANLYDRDKFSFYNLMKKITKRGGKCKGSNYLYLGHHVAHELLATKSRLNRHNQHLIE
jgi:hypothetical protein